MQYRKSTDVENGPIYPKPPTLDVILGKTLDDDFEKW